VLIAGALFDFARGGDLVECELQRVTGDRRHWAYRIVDGRECWDGPGSRRTSCSGIAATRLRRASYWTPRPRPSHLSRLPNSRLRQSNRKPPSQCRRNGARPPPTSCSRSPAAGRNWRSPPCPHSRRPKEASRRSRPKKAGRRPGRWPCYHSGCTRSGGLARQEDHRLFVPGMLAE
jgi:hypothetical protein